MSDTTATIGLPAEPTDALTGASLEALEAYRAAHAESRSKEQQFRDAVHPKMWELHMGLIEQAHLTNEATIDLHINELCRHFPGLAPAMRLAWVHILDTHLDRVGACCTDGGPIDP